MVEIISNQDFEVSSYITGSFMLIFYILLLTYPYIVSRKYLTKRNFLFSTALKYSDKLGVVLFTYGFIVMALWLLAYKGVLFDNGIRIVIPVALILFGFAVITILWRLEDKYSYSHYFLAFIILLAGQLFLTIIYLVYRDVCKKKIEFKIFTALFAFVTINSFLLLIFMLFLSNYSMLISIFEITHFIIVFIAMILYITFPIIYVIEEGENENDNIKIS